MARLPAAQVRGALPVERRQEAPPGGIARAGLAAGALAGAAMLTFAAASIALAGGSPRRPLALTAAMFGPEAAEGVGGLVAAGLLWLVVSVALATIFAALFPGDLTFGCAAIVGLGYAFVAMSFITSLVLPAVNPVMREAMRENGGAWVLAYAAFGAALGLVPALRRRLAR